MRNILLTAIVAMLALPVLADNEVNNNEELTNKNEFGTETNYEEGFLTKYVNDAIAKGMDQADRKSESLEYGRKVTKFASAPKFGGYFMGGYYYSSKDGGHSGDGFKQKNVRAYVSGTVLNDFGYLMQVQLTNNSFHMKDYWLDWHKYKEFQVKVGQFIRVFGYECPYNPFEFYEHSYAQISSKLCAQSDRIGIDNGGGRDQGIQFQGDLLPVGKDKHRLLHYQVMVSNGQTINSADQNSQKDVSGCIAIQPVAGLRLAVWGWTGTATAASGTTLSGVKCDGATVHRNRYMFSLFYEKNDWTFRSEYAHSTGNTILAEAQGQTDDKAQGWYATVGVPCTKWLKCYLKYDAYQEHATKDVMKTIWSIAPHIALHKNLYFLPSIGYVNDKTATGTQKYCEIFGEFAVRF